MDAVDFIKELHRMCNSYGTCRDCSLRSIVGDILCADALEKAIPIVEQWSKEHSKVTNLDHVAEGLEKLGYKVDKERLHETCPAHLSPYFTKYGCDELKHCADCRKWWDEEYPEQKEE